MATSDLSLELWLEIASYFHSGNLDKLLGISRTVFEFVMTKKYSEVLIAEEEETLRALEQLEFPSIAERVLHIIIYPNFLPILPIGSLQDFHTYRRRFSSCIQSRNDTHISEAHAKSIANDMHKTHTMINAVVKAVRRCSNLGKITILMVGYHLLWANLISTNFRKLSINLNTTILSKGGKGVAKDPLIVIGPSASNVGIDSGDSPTFIKISTVGASHHPCYFFDDWKLACKYVVSFLKAASKSLTSLFFQSGDEDLGPIFRNLPMFPELRTFELQAVFNAHSFSRKEQEWLTKFLQNHSLTLQMLVIKPKTFLTMEALIANPFLSVESATPIRRHLESNAAYTVWLTEEPGQLRETSSYFHQLILPQLQILNIGLQESVAGAQLFPDLYHIAPMLKKLTITDVKLTTKYLVDILDGLAIHDRKVILEELSYTCDELFYQIFDILAGKLPKLKKLTIDCSKISVCSDIFDDPTNLIGSKASQYPSSVKELQRFLVFHLQKAIEHYLFWPIRSLQLSYTGSRYDLHAGKDMIGGSPTSRAGVF